MKSAIVVNEQYINSIMHGATIKIKKKTYNLLLTLLRDCCSLWPPKIMSILKRQSSVHSIESPLLPAVIFILDSACADTYKILVLR